MDNYGVCVSLESVSKPIIIIIIIIIIRVIINMLIPV
jgi:hypothetical protein